MERNWKLFFFQEKACSLLNCIQAVSRDVQKKKTESKVNEVNESTGMYLVQ